MGAAAAATATTTTTPVPYRIRNETKRRRNGDCWKRVADGPENQNQNPNRFEGDIRFLIASIRRSARRNAKREMRSSRFHFFAVSSATRRRRRRRRTSLSLSASLSPTPTPTPSPSLRFPTFSPPIRRFVASSPRFAAPAHKSQLAFGQITSIPSAYTYIYMYCIECIETIRRVYVRLRLRLRLRVSTSAQLSQSRARSRRAGKYFEPNRRLGGGGHARNKIRVRKGERKIL